MHSSTHLYKLKCFVLMVLQSIASTASTSFLYQVCMMCCVIPYSTKLWWEKTLAELELQENQRRKLWWLAVVWCMRLERIKGRLRQTRLTEAKLIQYLSSRDLTTYWHKILADWQWTVKSAKVLCYSTKATPINRNCVIAAEQVWPITHGLYRTIPCHWLLMPLGWRHTRLENCLSKMTIAGSWKSGPGTRQCLDISNAGNKSHLFFLSEASTKQQRQGQLHTKVSSCANKICVGLQCQHEGTPALIWSPPHSQKQGGCH